MPMEHTSSFDGCFDGRIALVWGGGGGIGAETAWLLANRGAKVAVIDCDGAAAETMVAKLTAHDLSGLALTADVRSEAEVEQAVETAIARLGVPTLSACVVGAACWSDLIDMSVQLWDEQLALNLRPMFLIGRTLARALRDAGKDGALAFVGSIAAEQGAARHAAYGAAKGGMASLTKSMALEWGSLGIRVNCLAPGPIATDRIAASPAMEALLARKLPAGRFGTSGEIAEALVWLLSDHARFVTGTTIFVDGGWMATPAIGPSDNPNLPPLSTVEDQ
jgi:NAD(P)-dependent dehydrogenase (short-subunit alcohol dehydrogenase family)